MAEKKPEYVIKNAMLSRLTKNLTKHDIAFVDSSKSGGIDVAHEYIKKINLLIKTGGKNDTADIALSMISSFQKIGINLQDSVKLTSNSLYTERIVNSAEALETAKIRASSNLFELADRICKMRKGVREIINKLLDPKAKPEIGGWIRIGQWALKATEGAKRGEINYTMLSEIGVCVHDVETGNQKQKNDALQKIVKAASDPDLKPDSRLAAAIKNIELPEVKKALQKK
jgi:hypothetical protein